jgi:hypothetical protein
MESRIIPGEAEQKLRNRVAAARRGVAAGTQLPRQSDRDVEFLLTMLDIERSAVEFYVSSEERREKRMLERVRLGSRDE